MARMSFDRLPTEIVSMILIDLDSVDPSGLLAFACTNKAHFAAAVPRLYKTVRIWLEDESPATISEKANQLLENLTRREVSQHVRFFILDSQKAIGNKKVALTAKHREHDSLSSQMVNRVPIVFRVRRIPTDNPHANDVWRPVANLVRALPGLVDFFYTAEYQFAPCLLEAMHESTPKCRLWLNTFKLHSLRDSELDPHELALVTSRCLHSIKYDGEDDGNRGRDGRRPFNDWKGIYHVVAELAPTLQNAYMRCYLNSHRIVLANEESRNPGFLNGWYKKPAKKGSLQSLNIGDSDFIDVKLVTEWDAHTDFPALSSLVLGGPIDEAALIYLASTCKLSSLKHLTLNLNPYPRHLEPNVRRRELTTAHQSGIQFLLSLRPLASLTLKGWNNSHSITPVLSLHGRTLTRLVIEPYKENPLTASDITTMALLCPSVQELDITIARSQGDSFEVEKYRSLGKFRALRDLTLRLDLTDIKLLLPELDEDTHNGVPVTPIQPFFDEFDIKPCEISPGPNGSVCNRLSFRNGDIRQMLVNAAIDEALVKRIFQIVEESKGTNSSARSLQSLEVSPCGKTETWDTLGYNGHVLFDGVPMAMERTWLATRALGVGVGIEVVQTDVAAMKGRLAYQKSFWEWRDDRLPAWLWPTFRHLWPTKNGVSWQDDWHSLPLAE
ncbi:uncharacterized protein N7473_006304 [Penicillium subrubescens]|uniref:Uncharacterized protein n=1 Tax=Penicillium subrubescens TaxID=1316194 RepID=A0A1Q5UEG5_9EURO|nr:uncharacterized protein N7473_006304 [Penicillium subrubescens]KAJ5896905.1 hypothetical protein N7473_006304 [Penicillium subrubescens]OKP10864.1 hypothetical protein PENSUB_3684 [Penicillium subrubescens]